MSRALSDRSDLSPRVWPSLAMIAGGVLLIVLWPVFTTLHGPTSFNEDGHLLGMDSLFWGSVMEGPSSLLIALGLAGSYTLLTGAAGRMAHVGFVLTMIGLVLPALVNLAVLAVMPPLLAPLLAVGLILMAAGNRAGSSLPRFGRLVLLGLGTVQVFAFVWFVAVRPDVLDQIYGYRIYGAVATVLFGAGWIALGVSLVTSDRGVDAAEPVAVTT